MLPSATTRCAVFPTLQHPAECRQRQPQPHSLPYGRIRGPPDSCRLLPRPLRAHALRSPLGHGHIARHPALQSFADVARTFPAARAGRPATRRLRPPPGTGVSPLPAEKGVPPVPLPRASSRPGVGGACPWAGDHRRHSATFRRSRRRGTRQHDPGPGNQPPQGLRLRGHARRKRGPSGDEGARRRRASGARPDLQQGAPHRLQAGLPHVKRDDCMRPRRNSQRVTRPGVAVCAEHRSVANAAACSRRQGPAASVYCPHGMSELPVPLPGTGLHPGVWPVPGSCPPHPHMSGTVLHRA